MATTPARIADALLELTGPPAYTTPGFALRRRLFDWETLDSYDFSGRTVLITGATSGIGHAAATAMARLGAQIRSVSRDGTRADEATARIRAASGNDDVRIDVVDLSRPVDVVAYGERFCAEHDRLDLLAHVAGDYFPDYTETPEGVEANAAVYVLGPYLLTRTVSESLRACPMPRIITVTSGGMYMARFDGEEIEEAPDGYRPLAAYARAKRNQMVLSHLWARSFGTTARVHAMQPGWCRTPLVERGMPRFRAALGPILRTPEQGADTLVWLGAAHAPLLRSDGLWRDRRQRLEHRFPWTWRRDARAQEEQLREWCESRSQVADSAHRL